MRKCNAKNKDKVGCLTLNPPHIHKTKLVLIIENKFVITVPPHKDICPQGKT
jgi:hypothetical protein